MKTNKKEEKGKEFELENFKNKLIKYGKKNKEMYMKYYWHPLVSRDHESAPEEHKPGQGFFLKRDRQHVSLPHAIDVVQRKDRNQ